jgi:predicted lipoprotein with Yx(FWY)xxD motif
MKPSRLLLPLAAPAVVAAIAGCGSSGNATAATPASPTAAAAANGRALAVHSSNLGKILVDSKGNTLYAFGHDLKNKSRCSGACASNWPPALTKAKKPKVGAGVSSAKLRVIKRSDGGRQLSYAGHPLYRFSLDRGPGDMNGQGLNAFGGTWHVVSPAGKPVTHAPQSSSTPSPAPRPAVGATAPAAATDAPRPRHLTGTAAQARCGRRSRSAPGRTS